MRKAYKKAIRQKAKEQGAYDGRFAPRVEKDPAHEKDKYLCREDVEVPVEEEEINLFDWMGEDGGKEGSSYEEPGFSPSLGDVLTS